MNWIVLTHINTLENLLHLEITAKYTVSLHF